MRFFREELRHTKGRFAGAPFIPTGDQETDIREIFGRVDERGDRVIRTVFKEIPKKSGKSEEAAGIALKLLFADDEPGGEIYGAAADIMQASIVFNVAASMVRHNPKLLKRSKIWDSTKRIIVPYSESYYRAVTSKVAGKHGFNSHGVIFDEVHAQSDMSLWDVLTFGAGAARSQPLTYAITTAGIVGESPVAEMLHNEADQILRGILPCPDHHYVVMHSAEEGDDWASEEVWYACNPFLREGIMRIEDIRKEFDDARRRPEQQNTFKRLRLCQWVKQETAWLDMDTWDACNKPVDVREVRDLPCYGGIDLSTRLDLTAFVLVFVDGNGCFHLLPYFWIPADNMQDRPWREAHKYRTWADKGLLTVTPGNEVDFETVRRRIKELGRTLDLKRITYDPMFATQLGQQLQADGFHVEKFPQSYQNFTEPCREFESALLAGRVRHGGHPILRWMADCVTVKQRDDGAIRPVKQDRLKTSKRIDGIVAALMALSGAIADAEPTSRYEEHGLRSI